MRYEIWDMRYEIWDMRYERWEMRDERWEMRDERCTGEGPSPLWPHTKQDRSKQIHENTRYQQTVSPFESALTSPAWPALSFAPDHHNKNIHQRRAQEKSDWRAIECEWRAMEEKDWRDRKVIGEFEHVTKNELLFELLLSSRWMVSEWFFRAKSEEWKRERERERERAILPSLRTSFRRRGARVLGTPKTPRVSRVSVSNVSPSVYFHEDCCRSLE
jgi:hypothetical protein